jgi:3-methyladenine DNA glycosylase AlkD
MKSTKVELFLTTLRAACIQKSDPEIAAGQQAYMRNQFRFYGIKTPVRRALQRVIFQKDMLPPKSDLHSVVSELWELPERENQYIAQELARKYVRQMELADHKLYEYMITHKSWWDTVDFIAVNLAGAFFKAFPEKRDSICEKWMGSGNIWLQRTVLLFQLKYKEGLDTEFLSRNIQMLSGSREFFINKAIGWVLREYSKTDPVWVQQFVKENPLHSLSRKEALRLIIKTDSELQSQ